MAARGIMGNAEAVKVPERIMTGWQGIVASSDGAVIDRARQVFDLAGHVITSVPRHHRTDDERTMKNAILYSAEMQKYDFGPGHPFRGDRHASFMQLLAQTPETGPVRSFTTNPRCSLSPCTRTPAPNTRARALRTRSARVQARASASTSPSPHGHCPLSLCPRRGLCPPRTRV